MKSKTLKNLIKLTCIGILIVIISGILLGTPVKAHAEAETRYADIISTYTTTTSETVNYTRKEESYEQTVNAVPLYYQTSQYPNSCGPTAGAIIVGFYDKYYENLIPDFNPCISTGAYKRNDRIYIPQLFGDLYTLMRTNVDDVGVSETDCLNGLTSYVVNHGRTINYTNIKSSNKVDENKYASAVHNNQPTILFCGKVDLHLIATYSNYDIVSKSEYVGAHIAVGYGIRTIKYYDGNNVFRTDKYLQIAMGLSGNLSGLLKIDSTDWCNNAYVASIS